MRNKMIYAILFSSQPPKPDDVCTICYTSGTTGLLTILHRAYVHNIKPIHIYIYIYMFVCVFH